MQYIYIYVNQIYLSTFLTKFSRPPGSPHLSCAMLSPSSEGLIPKGTRLSVSKDLKRWKKGGGLLPINQAGCFFHEPLGDMLGAGNHQGKHWLIQSVHSMLSFCSTCHFVHASGCSLWIAHVGIKLRNELNNSKFLIKFASPGAIAKVGVVFSKGWHCFHNTPKSESLQSRSR